MSARLTAADVTAALGRRPERPAPAGLAFTGVTIDSRRARPGELFVVPRGVEHCPRADEETGFLIAGLNITSTAAGGKPNL